MLEHIEDMTGGLVVSAGSLTTAFTGNITTPMKTYALEVEHYKDATTPQGAGRCAIANELILYFTKTQGSAEEILIQVTESDTEAFTVSSIVPIGGAEYLTIKSSAYSDATSYRVGPIPIRGKYIKIAAKYSGGAATSAALTVYRKLFHNDQLASSVSSITGPSGLVADVRPTDLVVDEGLAYNAAIPVSAGSWAAGVVAMTSTGHAWVTGDVVTVSGCGNANYDGTYTLTGVYGNDWAAALVGDPGAFTTAGSSIQAQSTTRLVDENKSWTADEHSNAGRYIEITSGTGARQYAAITDNGTHWIAFSAITTAPVTSDSSYSIIELNVNALVTNTELSLKVGSITVDNIDAYKYRATQPDIAAGDSAQGSCDVKGNVRVAGAEAHDAAAARAPVRIAGYASDAAPTDVADGDVVNAWNAQNGALVVAGYDMTDSVARPIHQATDDAVMPALPEFLPVGGEYRASPTTYSDGDAAVLQMDVNGYLHTETHSTAGGTPIYGQKTVAVAGTEEPLAADQAVSDGFTVMVKALHSNTDVLVVGANGLTTSTGYPLYAGEEIGLKVTNLNLIYIDVAVSGEGAAYIVES